MTHPGFPPPLSKAHHERESDRVIDLRRDVDTFLEEVDEALETSIEASRKRHPSAYKTQGGEAKVAV